MKASIVQLKQDIADAKSRQEVASKDIKRVEKDIRDFDSNKDSKLAELEVCIFRLYSTIRTDCYRPHLKS